jgi:hypothetical protein
MADQSELAEFRKLGARCIVKHAAKVGFFEAFNSLMVLFNKLYSKTDRYLSIPAKTNIISVSTEQLMQERVILALKSPKPML